MRTFDQYYSVLLKQAVSVKQLCKVKQISPLSMQADDGYSSQLKRGEKMKISASSFIWEKALLVFVSSLAFVSLNLLFYQCIHFGVFFFFFQYAICFFATGDG